MLPRHRTVASMNNNYLITLQAQYDADGSPETLASAISCSVIELDFSLQLRPWGSEGDPRTRAYLGVLTLDYECDEAGWLAAPAVRETGATKWWIEIYELDDRRPGIATLAWRDEG